MSNDPQREKAPAWVQPLVQAKPAAAAPKPAHQAPSAAQIDQLAAGGAANAQRYAYPAVIDLGDGLIGKLSKHETFIFALGERHQGPRFEAKVTGDPAFRLAQAPLFLAAGSGAFDPSTAIKLELRPQRIGTFEGMLHIHVLDATNASFAIPLRAGAHATGGPTRAEAAAQQDAERARAADDARRRAQDAETDAAIEAEWSNPAPYHAGKKEQLASAQKEAIAALHKLGDKQLAGVDAAQSAIGDFKRKTRPQEDSLLEKLAWSALDVATSGIASAVAAKLKATLAAGSSKSPPLASLVSEGVKALVKQGGKAVKASLATKLRSGPGAQATNDPTTMFFLMQRNTVIESKYMREKQTALRAHDALLPLLRADPELAVHSMNAIATALDTASEVAETQATQSVRHWVRFVQETATGTLARPFSQASPLDKIDGLIDIRLATDTRPETPVRPVGMRVLGVRKAVLPHLAGEAIGELGVAIRAYSDLRSPSSSITVVRDPEGHLSFSESPAPSPHTPGWFERRAEAYGAGRDPHRGARMVMDQLLPLKLPDDLSQVENDSED